ncbi:MAG: PilZ domain-containing protein [Candidatus Omnitrophota bacterium]
MGDKSERRKSERVKTHIPVRYRKLRDGAGVSGFSSLSKNLSQGGIRFRTAEFISMACRLILELDIPMFVKPVKAISKVAWIKKTDSGNDYEVGNQFLEMSKKDKELISEYVNSLTMYNESGAETSGSEAAKKTEKTDTETAETTDQ